MFQPKQPVSFGMIRHGQFNKIFRLVCAASMSRDDVVDMLHGRHCS